MPSNTFFIPNLFFFTIEFKHPFRWTQMFNVVMFKEFISNEIQFSIEIIWNKDFISLRLLRDNNKNICMNNNNNNNNAN